MAITFEDITQANVGLTSVVIKGKEYIVVPQRVKAFRKLYPQGFITTEILSNDGETVVMRAEAGYYDENGDARILGTGTAFELRSSSFINKTSYIENCETSAIGRALGFLGFGIDGSIASAEELINAVQNQGGEQPPQPPRGGQKPAQQPAQVTATATVPPMQQTAPQAQQEPKNAAPQTGASYLKAERDKLLREMAPEFDFGKARKELIDSGEVEAIASAVITIPQAQTLIRKMREKYAHMLKKVG